MNEDEHFYTFMNALAEVQKQNDLIVRDMIISYIKSKLNKNG